jgi:hypothetical protein
MLRKWESHRIGVKHLLHPLLALKVFEVDVTKKRRCSLGALGEVEKSAILCVVPDDSVKRVGVLLERGPLTVRLLPLLESIRYPASFGVSVDPPQLKKP